MIAVTTGWPSLPTVSDRTMRGGAPVAARHAQADDRHQEVADERLHDAADGRADDHADGKRQRVLLEEEVAKVLEHWKGPA